MSKKVLIILISSVCAAAVGLTVILVVVLGGNHTHSYGTEWKSNAAQHWHECSCGEKSDAANHAPGGWLEEVSTGSLQKKCTVCGYALETDASTAAATPNLRYDPINGNTEWEVSFGTAAAADIVIPAYHLGKPVTAIKAQGFYDKPVAITSVKIPVTIENIGTYAFYMCDSLESITIHPGVKTVGDYAFTSCKSLESVTFASGIQIEAIGKQLFQQCESLKSISIPASVKTIGDYAFGGGCKQLKTVIFEEGSQLETIGDGVFNMCEGLESVNLAGCKKLKTIGESAFNVCESLKAMEIPASVETIGAYAFGTCISLESLTVAAANVNYLSENNILYNKAKTELITAAPLGVEGDLIIPAGVITIHNWAFGDCKKLESVTVPASVETIGGSAFSGSHGSLNIKTVTFAAGSKLKTFGSAFFANANIKNIIFEKGCRLEIFENTAFTGSANIEILVIPASVKTISATAFNFAAVEKVYYEGADSAAWDGISIGGMNTNLTSASRYYYSETSKAGHWRYVDGIPALW